MIYLNVMYAVCFGIIVFILKDNGITYQDLSFWGIMVTILVMMAVTTLHCKEVLSHNQTDTK